MRTADQIRAVARSLRDRWQSDLVPQGQGLYKTLVFAKNRKPLQALDDIVRTPT